MIEIFYMLLAVTIFYAVPLIYCMKKAYEEVEGTIFVLGVIPLVNVVFMFIDLVFKCSETITKEIKRREKL